MPNIFTEEKYQLNQYGQNFSPFGMMDLHKSQEDFLEIINGKKLNEENYSLYEEEYTESITDFENYNLNIKMME